MRDDGRVGLVDERAGLEPEPGQARGAGGRREELEFERGQGPAGIKCVRMELRDVMRTDWRRALMAGMIGGCTSLVLRLVVTDPWVGVLVTAAVMAWFMLEALAQCEENEALKQDRAEMEKMVVALRSTMHEMSQANKEREAVNRKIRWRSSIARQGTANSL